MQKNDIDLDSMRRKALADYISMPVARTGLLAKRLGVPKELVEKWHQEDNWLRARNDFKQERFDALTELLGSPEEAAERAIALCSQIEATLSKELAHSRVKPQNLEIYAKTTTHVFKLRQHIYTEMGLK